MGKRKKTAWSEGCFYKRLDGILDETLGLRRLSKVAHYRFFCAVRWVAWNHASAGMALDSIF
jgi:hypothetical protein